MSGGQSITVSQGVLSPDRRGLAAQLLSGAVGVAVTVAMVGLAITAVQGRLSDNSDGVVPLAGQAATVSAGTAAPSWEQALTGSASASAIGSVAINLRPTDISSPTLIVSAGTMSASGNSLTVNISGIEAAFDSGSVGSGDTLVSGNTITSSAGTALPSGTVALGGTAASWLAGFVSAAQDANDVLITSGIGSTTLATSVALAGVSATSATGTLSVTGDVSLPLTGESIVSAIGVVGFSYAFPITGGSITTALQSMGAPGWADLTGQAATVVAGNLFTTNDRDVALTGSTFTAQQGIAFPVLISYASGQVLIGSAQEFGPRNVALVGLQINSAQGEAAAPSLRAFVEAGGRKKRHRYIARYKGEDIEFDSVEALDSFVRKARAEQKEVPKKRRDIVRIAMTPEFEGAVSRYVPVPSRLQHMPPAMALANVRRIEQNLAKRPAETYPDDDDEDILLWLM